MSNGLGVLLLLVVLVGVAINIWLFVVAVQFLRTGTQANKRYLALTQGGVQSPARPPFHGGGPVR